MTASPSDPNPGPGPSAPTLRPLARLKPYKAALPEDTVNEIRSRLARWGMAFVEEEIGGESGRHSCALRLVDAACGAPVFQTIGKGRTNAYAKASAYGEMIERIQNLAFYMMLLYPSEPETEIIASRVPFRYFPDEKILSGEERERGFGRLFRRGALPDGVGLPATAVGVPFWNVFGERREFLPFRAFQVVVGSNGMCSGNTPAEALIHGICEVFERYVLKRLFLSPWCPPDVPLEQFAGHAICDDLRRLADENDLDVRVKDCSADVRLPVLGLRIRDSAGRYAFHLGADPSPVTALERCFTEMCQGGRILFQEIDGRAGESGDVRVSEFWKTQLHLNIRSYEGQWPPAVLRDSPQGRFGGFGHPVSRSDEEDLRYVVGIVRDAGWDLLVRDHSFLGFPSYHVYIPGISEMTNAVDDEFALRHLAFDRHVPVLTNPAGATPAQREAAVRAMERYAASAPSRRFLPADYLAYFPGHPFVRMPPDALREYLLRPAESGQDPEVPACFRCETCRCVDRCRYPFLSDLWARLRQAMVSEEWNSDDLRRRFAEMLPA